MPLPLHLRGALIGLCATPWLCAPAAAAPADHSPYRRLSTFARALAHIEQSYVEPIDEDALVYGAVHGMLRTLDPHSDYLDPIQYRVLASDTQGRFGGIGVEIDVRDGWLTVTAVFPTSPAQRAGLQPGDRFLTIDGVPARDMPVEEAVRRMRGEAGSEVRVSLRRGDDEPAIEATLRREIISVNAVEGLLLSDRSLYVRLRVFQESTIRELRDVLDRAQVKARPGGGVRGVVLDLRDNPGGLLDQAVLVADEFLSEGVIVTTRGRGDQPLEVASAHEAGTRPDWPMVILVNGYTASAAEIVAGALRDHARALIAGTRTFGKGSVQNIIELPDASALKLTVARYYTPSGRSIQARGIEPDIEIEQILPEEVGGATRSEASLERHLAPEHEGPLETAPPARRDQVRRQPTGARGPEFPDDFQLRMATQALRAISLDRERLRKR